MNTNELMHRARGAAASFKRSLRAQKKCMRRAMKLEHANKPWKVKYNRCMRRAVS